MSAQNLLPMKKKSTGEIGSEERESMKWAPGCQTRNSFGSHALLLDLLSIFGFLCSFCRELAALSKTGKTTLFGLVECTYEFNTPREIPPNYIPSPGTDKLTFCCRFLHFLGENDG